MGRVVVVVGGGISGLGAARVLAGGPVTVRQPHGGADSRQGAEAGAGVRPGGADLEVVVIESDYRFGGKILSSEFRGRPVDLGPDNFLTRNPSAAELSRQLGIGEDLVAPATSSASVVARGRLHPLPAGLVLGLPPDLLVLARSRIVSARGLARAALDLVPLGKSISAASLGLPPEPAAPGRVATPGWTSDPGGPEWSAASILERRLGRELVERLVDPLLGGINAGGLDHLSLTVVAPQVAQALVGHRSVTGALRQMMRDRPAPSPAESARSRPFFLGMRGGLGRIVEELVSDLQARGVKLQTGRTVTGLRRTKDRYELATTDGTVLADGVVLATPGHVSARLLVEDAPAAAAELGSIPHSSVALVTLAWASGAIGRLPQGSGFLVPRREGHIITGCTFLSAKWPYVAAPGEVVIRASTGRYGDERSFSMSDEELTDAVLGELRMVIGAAAPPLASLVQRWPRAFPQYLPGHLGKIERARAALSELPAIELAGPSLGGIGIPACLTSGERAALEVLDRLGA
ncbi:MAG: protoporphyrinogen oxidase [Acidimicrobiales bacterium]|jgi:oxygen-dependent protoporphyrinogen oxidase